MVKSPSRIAGYIMKSDFKTPITCTIDGKTMQAQPTINQGKIGVKVGGWFVPASKITEITTA